MQLAPGEREPGNRRLAIEAFETGAAGSLLGFLDNGVRAAELRHHRAEKEDEILIFGDASFDDRQQAGMVGVRKDTPLLFRSEEHTSELQSLMRISYAVFCLKKKKNR